MGKKTKHKSFKTFLSCVLALSLTLSMFSNLAYGISESLTQDKKQNSKKVSPQATYNHFVLLGRLSGTHNISSDSLNASDVVSASSDNTSHATYKKVVGRLQYTKLIPGGPW